MTNYISREAVLAKATTITEHFHAHGAEPDIVNHVVHVKDIEAIPAADVVPVATIEQEKVNDTSMFVVVERTRDWEVVYHKQTKVMYAYSIWFGGDTRCNSGFTALLDANGMPLLWKGE